MCLARERDVDMVLLAGDLFHENKPSRKSMYQVMRSLRMNCYGDKPCELEMLSDASENFQGAFNHVNYEDPDINVAIPVFSIHGNHDDPSGEGHLAALDLLQISGLLNYYGRTPESDNIHIKPVLLQKGRTKLALYGMSNVRDERLFRTFRDGKVKFFQPSLQKKEWFNLMSVHQNHHSYTETGYLPENFLPDFLDVVVWGHEHECLIDPKYNPEMGFHVMQPGSSVATSLCPGEAVTKQVAIMSITGREFKTENIRLKSVRPFVMREIVLAEQKGADKLAKKANNRTEVTRLLMGIVEELIEEAKAEWAEAQDENEDDEELECPLPLIRLRVETSTPDGSSFDCENPQRFSNRFVGRVANVNDVVQFHRKKKSALSSAKNQVDEVDAAVLSHLSGLDTVKVEKLVREFLTAQSLTILPQNSFGDAVSQFVDKDDKHAMEMFVNDSLASQIKHLLALDRSAADDSEEGFDEETAQSSLQNAMDKYRTQLEDLFAKGNPSAIRSRGNKKRFKPRPDGWDSEFDGDWEDQPGALIHSDDDGDVDMDGNEDEDEEEPPTRKTTSTRGRGSTRGARGRGAKATTASTSRTTATASKSKASTPSTRKLASPTPPPKRQPPSKTTTSTRKRPAPPSEIDSASDNDFEPPNANGSAAAPLEIDDDDDDDSDSQALFFPSTQKQAAQKAAAASKRGAPARKKRISASPAPQPAPTTSKTTRTRASQAPAKQTTLSFSQAPSGAGTGTLGRSTAGKGGMARSTRAASKAISDDDDDDAFEPVVPSSAASGSGRKAPARRGRKF